MSDLRIGRATAEGTINVGTVFDIESPNPQFAYAESYLSRDDSFALSFSLPLREKPYREDEFRPYFQGLLPEGPALERLAAQQRLRQDDYLGILARCGLDCIGDVVLDEGASHEHATYLPVHLPELLTEENSFPVSAKLQSESRLSLAGTQSKTGLFHDERTSIDEGWYQPLGGAPSNYIVKYASEDLPDLAVTEALSMSAARACGVRTAPFVLLGNTFPTICSKRFDRIEDLGASVAVAADASNRTLRAPLRLHQEDFTQALGLMPGSKYTELEPSTAKAVADFIQTHFATPALDRMEFARLACFNFLIGNCDNHLKNISIVYSAGGAQAKLAPAYDLVSTTHFQRFTRKMGMKIGSASVIDDVTPGDIRILADDLGLAHPLMHSIAADLATKITPSLQSAATALNTQGHTMAPYIADEMEEDIEPRRLILENI